VITLHLHRYSEARARETEDKVTSVRVAVERNLRLGPYVRIYALSIALAVALERHPGGACTEQRE